MTQYNFLSASLLKDLVADCSRLCVFPLTKKVATAARTIAFSEVDCTVDLLATAVGGSLGGGGMVTFSFKNRNIERLSFLVHTIVRW